MGGGWALEIEIFLGPMKWHPVDRRVPFGPKKLEYVYNKYITKLVVFEGNNNISSKVFSVFLVFSAEST